MYQLTCLDCNNIYIGQTGSPFHTRFQNISVIINMETKNQNLQKKKNLLENKHENVMDILHITNKGKMMNTLERFHIYNETKIDNQLNDKCRVRPDIIFDTLILKYTNRGHSPL